MTDTFMLPQQLGAKASGTTAPSNATHATAAPSNATSASGAASTNATKTSSTP